ncbi:MAG: hypothetical protein ACK4MF_09355 [Hyphomicrobiaceae bacterium]
MSNELIGLIAGGAFGFANFVVLRWLADRMQSQHRGSAELPAARALRMVAWVDLIVFPLVGYFVAPIVLG